MRTLGIAGVVVLLAAGAGIAAPVNAPRSEAADKTVAVAQTVPEPGTFLLIGCGLVAAGLVGSRRHRG